MMSIGGIVIARRRFDAVGGCEYCEETMMI